jgi:hypothetical protein
MTAPKKRRRSTSTKKSLADVVERYNDVTLMVAFLEAILELCNEHFAYHDGMEPKSIVVSLDGRRVPEHMISEMLSKIEKEQLAPLQKELDKLNKQKV